MEFLTTTGTTTGKGKPLALRRTQKGVVLIVSLIFLTVVTMIAVSSLQGAMLEERMAGNTLDRNVAFQSAESALREAEDFIEQIATLGNFNGTGGLYGRTDDEPSYHDVNTWAAARNLAVATESYGAYEPPRYYIKHYTTVSGSEGALNLSGYGDNKGSDEITVFRITARGTGGGADSAEVIVRTQYGRIL